ncbi:S-layer homology domain-containing protein [Paenibacillus flagellatus]|uniref:SLH domain-containing protein n=1 Tax=Paenibacillus flagellatus TaxID=2211139 RepID=A0A2V5KA96_9BACL|nr:S-layer homology domain-containing protein [Paenibacillus flagellatus]PYI56358.1 hypothetical protein DLM86_05100 [Paenibacillus flagellatus]
MTTKRLIVSVLMSSLFLCTPVYAFAESGSEPERATLRLEVDGKPVSEGERFAVQVVARDPADLYGVQVRVKYDPSKLTFRQVQPQGAYSDFGGSQIDETEGTVVLPLLRQGASSSSSAIASLSVAKLEFAARSSGVTKLAVESVKAVTGESYLNANGYPDLKELAIVPGRELTLPITPASSSSSEDPAPPAPVVPPARPEARPGLQELEKKLASNDPEQALAQLSSLLSGGAGSYSPAEMKRLEELAGQLQRQWLHQVKITEDAAAKSMRLDRESLAKTVEALRQLSELGASRQWKVPAEANIRVRLADNGSSSLLVTSDQAKQLAGGKVSLLLENERGAAAVSPEALAGGQETLLQLRTAGEQAGRQTDARLNFVSGLQVLISAMEDGKPVAVAPEAGLLRLTLRYEASAPNVHKLGVYAWNESTSAWEYVRNAKPEGGEFEVAAARPGVYALMEYSANYKDIEDVYEEARYAIEALSAKHVMDGTAEEAFSPFGETTRAEFVSLLVRMLDLDSTARHEASFRDVEADAWYAGAVNAAYRAGIVRGDGENMNPDGKLTREEMAVMLANAGLVKTNGSGSEPFADDDAISDWAREAIYAARAGGLLNGVGDNAFSPKSGANRADVAVMLLRLIEQR